MKQRSIPYGYTVKNGKNLPHADEFIIVQRIFKEYFEGGSFKSIAQTLTHENISFLPGRSDWNKNRIKRILEDTRYTGTSAYPAIISTDVFGQIQTVKNSNS